jgi:glycosyltransferase involved in cell wall biosynthesis
MRSDAPKNVLFFSYLFPPMGGGGVQRSASFVGHLPEHGYRPHVVTAPRGTGLDFVNAAWLARFRAEDIHRCDVRRRDRLRRIVLGNGFVERLPKGQDQLVWWTQSAVRTCLRVAAQHRMEVLYTSVNPWAGAAVGRIVARACDVPWVVDFRDPWAIDDLSVYLTRLHHWADVRSMARVCRAADAIIMNTPAATEALLERFPDLSGDKVFCIPNGFEVGLSAPDPGPGEAAGSGPLHVVHSGELFTRWAAESDQDNRRQLRDRHSRWKHWITDPFLYRPGQPNLLCRSPFYFFGALQLLRETKRIGPDDIRVTMVGHVTDADRHLTERLGLESMVTWTGYVPLAQSIEISSRADVLLLLQHKPRNGASPLSVPGKLFEYIGHGKLILALVPRGDARTIVERAGLGPFCEPDGVEAIAQSLLDVLDIHRGRRASPYRPNFDYIAQFNRRALTEQLAHVFGYASASHQLRAT